MTATSSEHNWQNISLSANLRAESKVAVTQLSSKAMQLFVHGSDGFIYTCLGAGLQAKWSAWQPMRGRQFSGTVDVAAVVRKGSRAVDLLVSHNESEKLTVWGPRGSESNWEAWRSLQSPWISK